MSRVARQKHIRNELWTDDYSLPKENQIIARIVQPKGNNLHEVEPAVDEETCLASMPTKFRRNVWVKRGDFVLVEPIDEGDKVKFEIVRVLTAEHVKEYTKANIWPKKFTRKRDHSEDGGEDEEAEEDEDAEFQNPNRRHMAYDEDSEEEEDDDDEDTSDE